jgi:hypothetical protein
VDGSLDCKVAEMIVYVASDDVEADLAGVEGLGSEASRAPLREGIAVMLVPYRRWPTVNYRRSVPRPSWTQREIHRAGFLFAPPGIYSSRNPV